MSMRARRPGRALCRAAIAVAALYALVLQAVLGGAAFAGPVDPAGDPLHALCAPGAGSADAPSGQHGEHAHLPCCTAAHPPSLAAPPDLSSIAIVWPLRHAVAVVWRPEAAAAPRAPPGVVASARAPPVV